MTARAVPPELPLRVPPPPPTGRSTAVGMCGQLPPADMRYPEPGPWSSAHACILDAGHPGWHRDEAGMSWGSTDEHERRRAELEAAIEDGLIRVTTERWIRSTALAAAVTRFPARGDLDRDADAVLDLAGRFEAWIRDGAVHEGHSG